MPGTLVGNYATPVDLKIAIFATRDDPLYVRLSMVGEVDVEAYGLLADTVDWLNVQAPTTVLIDLADVTFAGSALPNFLSRAFMALPNGSEMILCGAKPSIQQVLRATEMAKIATIADGGSGSSR